MCRRGKSVEGADAVCQSQRDCAPEPKVARNELPWVACGKESTPTESLWDSQTGYEPNIFATLAFTASSILITGGFWVLWLSVGYLLFFWRKADHMPHGAE